MKYIGEKDFRHGQRDRAGVLLVNLGTPNSTEVADVRRYLAEFLSDPRIVEAPRLLWKAVLHGIILRTRPRKSAEAYKEVWTDEGSPLLLESQKITQAVAAHFEGHDIEFGLAMRYGDPSVPSMMEKMRQAGVRRLLVLPMYPQYSATTSGSVMDAIYANLLKRRWMPELRTINQFFDQDSYIEALAASVRESWETNGRGQKLVLSYHGVPKRYLVNGDPYHCQCHKTSRLLADKLGISSDDYMTVFQSRFGREEWLQPYCDKTLEKLPSQGIKDIDIICPAFSADCLETLEEIAGENHEIFMEAGGERYQYIPCLNDRPDHVAALAELVKRNLQGWPEAEANPTVVQDREAELAESRRLALELGGQ